MKIALPRLKDKFYLPADRINLPYCWSLPYRVWHIGEKEVPGSEGEMRLGWRIAFFLGLLFCETPSLIDDALWETRRHETTGHPLLGSEENSVLRTIARYGCEPRGQGQRLHLPRLRVQEWRLMIEATEKIRPSGGNARNGFDLKVASIKAKEDAFLRSGHHSVDIPLIGPGPGGQRKMTKHPVFM